MQRSGQGSVWLPATWQQGSRAWDAAAPHLEPLRQLGIRFSRVAAQVAFEQHTVCRQESGAEG